VTPNDPLRGHPASHLPSAADVKTPTQARRAISACADVGHVNLTVTDLGRAVAFYRDVIGLRLTQRDAQSAFLAAGTYHHHVALNTWDPGVKPPPAHVAGLHHFALRLPDAAALAAVVIRIVQSGHELLGATDHGVNLAVYLKDPDGNGLELMVDRPAAEWPRKPDGTIAMTVAPFDVRALVADCIEASKSPESS
jgi:catechol 2,3-dioxygenase